MAGFSSLDKIVFNKLLILIIITCVCETIAGIVKGKMFIGARAILEISDILYDEVFVIFAYVWLSYVVVKLNEEVNSKVKRVRGQISDKMFLCRYGGDEFLLIDKIKDLLSEELVKKSEKKTLYSLKLSVGVASGNCIDENDISDLIRLADMKMYEEKRVSKLNA